MDPDTRALIAAAAHSFLTGEKVAGLYDHAAARHRRLAAEAKGAHLQGYDGDRDSRFGGTLPEIRDVATGAQIHLTLVDGAAQGYDRRSAALFTVRTVDRLVQLYDHKAAAWFPFQLRVA